MNIVHVEDFFHPNAGYQVNILAKYMATLGHKVTIITSELNLIPHYLTDFFGNENIEKEDKIYTDNTNVQIIRLPLKKYLSGRAIFGRELEQTVNSLAPDILYVHGNDTLTSIRFICKAHHLPYALISDSHMLEMASANKLRAFFRLYYKKIITPKIINNNIKIIRTQNDNYVERCLGIPLELCPYISFGSDTLMFHPDLEKKRDFRIRKNLKNEDFIICYIGKLDISKNGKLLAEAFKNKFNTKKNVVLIAVGSASGRYGEEVEQIFKESSNIILRFPTQKYTDLAQFYQASDLAVFPQQCSLSFFDAQACGLPVLAENNDINVERLSNNNGFVFHSGSIDSFREKILDCIEMPIDKYKNISENAVRYVKTNYDYQNICEHYMSIIDKEWQHFKISKRNDTKSSAMRSHP